MKRQDELLDRLAACARRETASALGEAEVPIGMATRVVALASVERAAPGALVWQRLAFGAVPVAATVFLACWLTLPDVPAPATHDAGESLASAMFEEALSR